MAASLRAWMIVALAATLIAPASGQAPAAGNGTGSPLRFAVIGDNGTGKAPQYEVGRQMLATHATHPYAFVLMMGDNMYGSQKPRDFVDKFEIPYGPLLRMKIPFYAALGNHDDPDNRHYPHFNMGGQRYYTMAKGPVRFFILDTNFMDAPQVRWLDAALASATEPWKIAVFHHPIYSNGDRHGPNVSLRVVLEPILIRHGVAVGFSGHEHVYERITAQKGIPYFIVGSSGQLRRGGITPAANTAASFADDQAFLIAAIDGDTMTFRAISRTGAVVDAGVIRNRNTSEQ